MNKRIVFYVVILALVSNVRAQVNLWDGNNYGYDGAFGLADKSSPSWSTATDIRTIRTPSTNDTPSGALGFLMLLNRQDTTVTITNSFKGLVQVANGAGTASVDNKIISLDSGVTVTGAQSSVPGGVSVAAAPSIRVVGNTSDDSLTLGEGHYVGGEALQGVLVVGLGELRVNGSNIEGGGGSSFVEGGASVEVSSGGVGLFANKVNSLVIDSVQRETDIIKGGNGGNGVYESTGLILASSKGGDGILRNTENDTQELRFIDGIIKGGNGGVISAMGQTSQYNLTGGRGVNVIGGVIKLESGAIHGGDAGTITLQGSMANSTALGGDGLYINGAKHANISEIALQGGRGGTVSSTTSSDGVVLNGGNGLKAIGNVEFASISNSSIYGGSGGMLHSMSSSDVQAIGGDGVNFSNVRTNTFYNVNLLGGTGGEIVDETGSAQVSGGRAAYIGSGSVVHFSGDSVLRGGDAGSLNGVLGSQGVALEVQDASVTITNGTFTGSKGLLTSTAGGSSAVTVLDGEFGDVEFGGNDETLTLTGGTYGELLLSGTGTKQLALGVAANITDRLVLTAGQVDVSSWADEHFNRAFISNGTLNVLNADFTMDAGSSLVLVEDTAVVDFKRAVSVFGSLDLGLGSVVASNFSAKAGAQLASDVVADGVGGNKAGAITGQNLTFESGVKWGLIFDNAIGADESLLTNGIKLAEASGTLSNDIDAADVRILANNPDWLKGINGLTNINDKLFATYGNISLEILFEDYDPELQKAMGDLYMTVENDPALRAYIADTWLSLEEAVPDFEQGFIRTPEMASALMGLQGVFADQIKSRTRSNLRYKKFGSRTAYSPAGSRGPSDWYDNSVQWTKDHMPKWDAQSAQRKASDRVPMPNIEGDPVEVSKAYNSGTVGKGNDYAAMQDALRSRTPAPSGEAIEVPETYQVWGRGYGSHINQDSTTGHFGYDATIAGGVLGMDKRFEKLMIGLGAGYARTMLNGNGGNDGDADTVHAVGYFSHNSENLYFDASVNYAFNDVSTEGIDSLGYEGDYNAQTLGFALGTGYGMSFFKDKWLFTPEASYLGTFYSRESYTEKSSLDTPFPDKAYDSYDEWSHLTSIGATLSMIGVIESFKTELEYRPEVRAHWLHEFNADLENDSYVMAGGSGDSIAVALQAREEDLVRLGAGIRISEWQNDTTEFGLDVDGAFGADYHNIMFSGRFMHRF